ncbi:MAG: hypothetical protein M0035_17320 [Actinomycetota bacterium]|nr:hypothetical protein [Actinomycetota bacterium]
MSSRFTESIVADRTQPGAPPDVLARLGGLSPNVEKFGHGLRDFCNYVHPAEQLAHGFLPDTHTARIGFQVVIAAAEDLVRAAGAAEKRTGQD